MSFLSILFLAVGLAMDATAVAAGRGLSVPRVLPKHVVLVMILFGGFQAFMPFLGWLIGARVGAAVHAWDHWIAFVLLGAIGGKMLWEAIGGEAEKERGENDPFALRVLLILALATSVDALAVGVTLPLLDAPFLLTLVTIGVTTAVLSALGLFAGRHLGAMLGKRLDIFGGILLIGLGTKVLVEHLTAGR